MEIINSQFYKKLKPNGLLLIREHNVQSIDDLYPVLMEHLVYELLEYDAVPSNIYKFIDAFIADYHKIHKGWYFSYNFLHDKLTKLGFKQVHFEYKKGNNVSRIYNVLYVKK